jgi:hypothetical protein
LPAKIRKTSEAGFSTVTGTAIKTIGNNVPDVGGVTKKNYLPNLNANTNEDC